MSPSLINELNARIAVLDTAAQAERDAVVSLTAQVALAIQHAEENEALAAEYRAILDGLPV